MLAARPLLFASVDPVVAEARGVPVDWLGLGFLLVLALVVAVAVQVVGVLLIFALLVTPAATARRLSTRPMVVIVLSVILAVVFTWLGLVAGYFTPFPVSFFITTFAFGFYVLVRLGNGLSRSKMESILHHEQDFGRGRHLIVLDVSFPHFTWNLWLDVLQMFQYGFMRNAFLAGTALSIISGLVGYFVIVRRQAFAGEALSDVAFTGAMGGAVLGINPLAGMIVLTIAGGAGNGVVCPADRRARHRRRHRSGMGAGPGRSLSQPLHYPCERSGFFRSNRVVWLHPQHIGPRKRWVIVAIAAGIGLALLVIARPLLFASVDPDVAAAHGVPVRLLGLVFMVLLAVTVAEAVQAVGALLVFALLLLPAAIAQRLTTRPYAALGLAVVLAVGSTWLGLTIGFYSGLPSSVCISLLAFVGVYWRCRLRWLYETRLAEYAIPRQPELAFGHK